MLPPVDELFTWSLSNCGGVPTEIRQGYAGPGLATEYQSVKFATGAGTVGMLVSDCWYVFGL